MAAEQVTIGCALCGKRCCGGASGRDRVELTQDAVNDQAIMKFCPDAGEDPFVKEKQFYDHCRGRLFGMSERVVATLCWITTQSSVLSARR